jgi:hypothetical protein
MKAIYFVLLLGITTTGCSLGQLVNRKAPGAPFTQAAQTMAAQITHIAETAILKQPRPSATSRLTATLAASSTPVPTDTPYVSPTASITPTPDLNATATKAPGISFSDDFSISTGWYTRESNQFKIYYDQDGYRITVHVLNTPIWSTRQREYADVHLEVDATWLSGADDGYYGLICRQESNRVFYALVISSDGGYGIAKSIGGVFQFIKEGSDQVEAINTGKALNRIGADCIGDTLALYANGEKLVEVQDSDIASGGIGLVAGTRTEPDLDVLFDNFLALKP